MGRIRSTAPVEDFQPRARQLTPSADWRHSVDRPAHARARSFPLTLTAIGVVYGDIGTSPLYAMRECFFGSHSVPPTHENVLGVLSLIIYSLLLVISIKYIAIVMRADNQGEGGILALTALLPPADGNGPRWPVLVLLGIFGAALLYGDGMITPAITVLGAVEGLKVATPLFEPYVVPIAVGHPDRRVRDSAARHAPRRPAVRADHGGLVRRHRRARHHAGSCEQPVVLTAVDPRHAVTFFREHGWHGFAVLGAVFLVVTGGEALYADMGHFGKRPIRIAWFALVLPALLLNYFGQGALLLTNPTGGASSRSSCWRRPGRCFRWSASPPPPRSSPRRR